jgi:hypothetical protein
MRCPTIQLVLLITLIGNLLVAPLRVWMGAHAATTTMLLAPQEAHGGCATHTETRLPDEQAPAGSCCDGLACDCGCLLIPVLRASALNVLAQLGVDRPNPAVAAHLRSQHGSVPLRPPSGAVRSLVLNG